MAQDPKSTRFRRIIRVQSDFDALAARVADLERAHADAVHTFNNARTIMDDAAAELDLARAKLLVSQNEISGLRLTYRRDAMQRMPVDILRWVFSEAVALPVGTRHAVQAGACWLLDCAKMPFTLAAVCVKWRSIALQHPALWTYLSTPYTSSGVGQMAHAQRISLFLERSALAPLDVLLNFHATVGDLTATALPLLLEVGRHSYRWRTFEVWLPDEMDFPRELDALKGPLPLLERICVINDHPGDEAVSSHEYLPFTPKLRAVVLWGPGTLRCIPHPSFPALVSLHLRSRPPLPRLWCMLEAAASTLQSLLLSFTNSEVISSWQCVPLSLPNLHSLMIDAGGDALLSRLQHLRLPHLRTLRMQATWANATLLIPWLETLADTVTALSLSGKVSLGDIETFKVLHNVECFNVEQFSSEAELDCSLDARFFDDNDVWVVGNVWPKLRSVVIRREVDLTNAERVLPFVRWRAGKAEAPNDASPRPYRIENFEIHSTTPEWLLAEVGRLLQPDAGASP